MKIVLKRKILLNLVKKNNNFRKNLNKEFFFKRNLKEFLYNSTYLKRIEHLNRFLFIKKKNSLFKIFQYSKNFFLFKNMLDNLNIKKKGCFSKKPFFKKKKKKELKKFFNYYSKNSIKKGLGFYDSDSLINLLKKKIKFQKVYKKFFNKCRVYFKYTGSNFFGTITNNLGDVVFSYSSGIFKNSRTRKEKTTIFVVRQLGELLALRLYKSNATEISFRPYINHIKVRTLLKNLFYGFRVVNRFNMVFSSSVIKRKIMRNGVRLKKTPRK